MSWAQAHPSSGLQAGGGAKPGTAQHNGNEPQERNKEGSGGDGNQ